MYYEINKQEYIDTKPNLILYHVSDSYEETELKYEWYSPLESDIQIYDAEMAQFTIVSAKRYLKHKVYHSCKYTGLSLAHVIPFSVSLFIMHF